MRYYKDGNNVIATVGTIGLPEITAEEYESEMANAQKRAEEQAVISERTRPLTESEVTALLIKQQINTLNVDDTTALRMTEFYPEWNGLIGQTVDKAGFRFTYGGKLYKTIPANHTFQADWVPGVGTESLYTRIDEAHAGTLADPIPAARGMEYTYGLYYSDSEDSKVYLCTRTGEADGGTVTLHYLPHELVGMYFEEVAG